MFCMGLSGIATLQWHYTGRQKWMGGALVDMRGSLVTVAAFLLELSIKLWFSFIHFFTHYISLHTISLHTQLPIQFIYPQSALDISHATIWSVCHWCTCKYNIQYANISINGPSPSLKITKMPDKSLNVGNNYVGTRLHKPTGRGL